MKLNSEKDLPLTYKMKLHEILPVETASNAEFWTSVMRVPGGWIYRSFHRKYNMCSNVFVPFNNEMMYEYKIGVFK